MRHAHFSTTLWRSLPNDNVKFANVRFQRQREHRTVNLSFSKFTSTALLPVHLQRALSTIKDAGKEEAIIPNVYFQLTFSLPLLLKLPIRELKKLRRQLQGKRHNNIELCVKLSLLRLFHVDHVVQNRRSALSRAWHECHEWFSCKGKEGKIYCCELPLSSEPQIWKFPVVVWQTSSKHCTKKRAARAERLLFFFIQPIKSLICGVVVDVAVVRS